MAKAKKPSDPSANEDMMPKGMGEVARQTLEQAKKDMKSPAPVPPVNKKKGGAIKKYARGGGIESRGKTRGRFV